MGRNGMSEPDYKELAAEWREHTKIFMKLLDEERIVSSRLREEVKRQKSSYKKELEEKKEEYSSTWRDLADRVQRGEDINEIFRGVRVEEKVS